MRVDRSKKSLPFLDANYYTDIWSNQKQTGKWFYNDRSRLKTLYYDNSFSSPDAYPYVAKMLKKEGSSTHFVAIQQRWKRSVQ